MFVRVFVVSFCLFACGCSIGFPKETWIDSQFTPGEEEAIVLAMRRWEEQLGRKLFIYRGRIDAGDFRKEALGDGRHIIYKIENIDEGDAREIWEFQNPGYGDGHSGWATYADMLIFMHELREDETEAEYLEILFGILMHEFGHSLFVGHINDERAVMCPDGDYRTCLTRLDIEAFCSLNGCDEDFDPVASEEECFARHGEEDKNMWSKYE